MTELEDRAANKHTILNGAYFVLTQFGHELVYKTYRYRGKLYIKHINAQTHRETSLGHITEDDGILFNKSFLHSRARRISMIRTFIFALWADDANITLRNIGFQEVSDNFLEEMRIRREDRQETEDADSWLERIGAV